MHTSAFIDSHPFVSGVEIDLLPRLKALGSVHWQRVQVLLEGLDAWFLWLVAVGVNFP